MKFFSDFVSCFGSINARSFTAERTVSLPLQESGSGLEQPGSRALMRNIRRKRGRSSGSASSSGDWKPSLGSISELNVAAVRRSVTERMRAEVDQQGKRKVKRKSFTEVNRSPSWANKAHHRGRSYSEDYGHGSVSAVLPVFAPTPFMF